MNAEGMLRGLHTHDDMRLKRASSVSLRRYNPDQVLRVSSQPGAQPDTSNGQVVNLLALNDLQRRILSGAGKKDAEGD